MFDTVCGSILRLQKCRVVAIHAALLDGIWVVYHF
jgi:hypothetical protein